LLHGPNRKGFDIDNRLKPLGDALQLAGVFADDGLIDKITVERGEIIKGGKCIVTLTLRET
jgi:crossover junction endodeoxyribonuclease RusA